MSKPFAPIAVVGAGAIFPGSTDVAGYWQNILSGKDLLTDVPASHWLTSDYYDADPKAPDRTYAKRGAFLPSVPFDPLVYGIPPSLLPATDTSQLLALIVAQQVLDDVARTRPTAVDRSRLSVILGVTGGQELMGSMASRLQRPVWENALRQCGFDEEEVKKACDRISAHYVNWQEATFPGLLGNVVAGRIANRLDFGGSNCITDAACASALSAAHLAILELQAGHSDMVVTGGVDTMNDIFMYMCFSKTPALSPTGDCRPFDASGDGTMLGEGIGMMALRRLEDAERDGDPIYAVIRGMGTSSDGRSKSVYAPVSEGQAKALRRCYEMAGYGADTVELVEAHGTGTKAGDAAEIVGLKMAFDESGRQDRQWCAIGSVKSQIGHTKATAGAAGMLKIVLALHHRVLPPTIKVKSPNPLADFPSSPFYPNLRTRPWIRGSRYPRRASVSSFGFGGSNYHLTAEEYQGPGNRPARLDAAPVELVLFQGKNTEELRAALHAAKGKIPAALARSSQLAYDPSLPCHLAILVRDDLDAKLSVAENTLSGKSAAPGVFFSPELKGGKLAFLFPGQGSQSLEMGAALAMRYSALRDVLDQSETVLPGLRDAMYPRPVFTDEEVAAQQANITRTENAQPAIGAMSAGMIALLAQLGIVPEGAAGHSFGELAALYCAGVFTLPQLLTAARRRGVLMAEAGGDAGTMIAVGATVKDLGELPEGVVLANHNAPDQLVLAGSTEAIGKAKANLEKRGLRVTPLQVATAFHSPLVAPAAEAFEKFLAEIGPVPESTIPVWSNLTAAPLSVGNLAEHLSKHLVSPVRWVEQVEAMYAAGFRSFVEVGPGSVLSGLVGRILSGRPHTAVAMDPRGSEGTDGLWTLLGRMVALGRPVDFAPLWADRFLSEPVVHSKVTVWINGANYGKPYPPADGKRAPANPPRQTAVAPQVAAAPVPVAAPLRSSPPPASKPPPSAGVPVGNGLGTLTNAAVGASAPAAGKGSGPHADRLNGTIRKDGGKMENRAPAAAWIVAFQESQRQLAQVQESFHRTLTDAHMAYLRAVEENSRALLGAMTGQALPAAPQLLPPPQALLTQAPAPSPRVAPVAPPVAPTHVSNVSHVSAATPAVHVSPVTHVSHVSTAAPAPAAPAKTNGVAGPAILPVAPAQDISKLLLDVVADKTGYPAEMLKLEMSLEADLGIDSIKRVEILSTLREKAPSLPELDAATLGKLRTLGQILDALPSSGSAAAAPKVAVAAAPAVAPTAGPGDLQKLLLEVVADKTGYPAEMLKLDMSLEADLGIDSIKRVEILSTLREKAPSLPELDAATLGKLRTLGQILDALPASSAPSAPAPAAVVAAPAPSAPGHAAPAAENGAGLQQMLLDVVADKTGYPAEMLKLEMSLEADLGIDSIKRVEILSTLREKAPSLPELDAATLGKLRTLGQILDALPGQSGSGATVNFNSAGEEEAGPLARMVLRIVAAPTTSPVLPGPLALLRDSEGLAARLLPALRARGVEAAVVDKIDDLPPDRGVVFLPGVEAQSQALNAFRAARKGRLGAGGAFVTVTRMGDFGLRGSAHPDAAALGGLVKTISLEHPGTRARAIDLDPALDADHAALLLADEILREGPLELALGKGYRHTIVTEPEPTRADSPLPGRTDVIVVSGGARGVTATCLLELARRGQPKLAILGRSPIDLPESAPVAAATDEAGIKRALFQTVQGLSPAELGKRAAAILAAREARANLDALRAAGSEVLYLAVDVADTAAVRGALATVRGRLGTITGLVHAAGVIQDKRLLEKTEAQWESVYRTKVDGARALLDGTAGDNLKWIVFFSSVAGRTGNIGQCDYAMANEVLNRTAAWLSTQRPGCVCRAIGWGPWEGGMVTPALKKQFEAMGVALIPLQWGAERFVAELGCSQPPEVVIGGELPAAAGTGPVKGGTVEKIASAAAYPYIADHVVGDHPVLPLVQAVSWLTEAAESLNPGRQVASVEKIQVIKGIILRNFQGAEPFSLRLEPLSSDRLTAELRGSTGTLHYRAELNFAANARAPAPPSLAPLASFQVPLAQMFPDVLFHGPALRVFRDTPGISDKGMEAELETSQTRGWPGRQPLDIAALDGALQLTLLWNRSFSGGASLPTGLGALRRFGQPEGRLRCLLRGRSADRSRVIADIWLVDASGKVIYTLEGVETHALPGGSWPRPSHAA